MAGPKRFPREGHAGSKSLSRQPEPVRRNSDREHFAVDLDLAADSLVELGGHDICTLIHVQSLTVRPDSWPAPSPFSEHIVDKPLPPFLSDDRISDDATRPQHLVGRLEDALQMRRVALRKGQLLA
jgi:hypothetical protein